MKKSIISIFLLFLILSQSCTIYQKQTVSIDQVIDNEKVMIVNNSEVKFEFENIKLENNIYYGMGRKYFSDTQFEKGEYLKTQLDSTTISSVYLKNRHNLFPEQLW